MDEVKKPKVSIITVCFNSEKTIKRTMESVLKQTYDNYEYIIIDGKSSDSTLGVVLEMKNDFESKGIPLTVVSEPDNGIYDAMNKGIRIAKGDIIGIINSDDWYEPVALETAANTYMDNKYDMFFADLRVIMNNGKTMIKKAKKDKFITSRHWNHPTTFIPKEIYNEIGVFALHSLYDDFDLYLRIRKAKKKITIKNVVLANFSFGGISNKKSFKKAMERCKHKYWCYRNNGYSRFYWVECFLMETAKYLLS